MAARRSSPCKLLTIVLHANREHRRDAYATLGSAMKTCSVRLRASMLGLLIVLFIAPSSQADEGFWLFNAPPRGTPTPGAPRVVYESGLA
jgi:hypothetical protein